MRSSRVTGAARCAAEPSGGPAESEFVAAADRWAVRAREACIVVVTLCGVAAVPVGALPMAVSLLAVTVAVCAVSVVLPATPTARRWGLGLAVGRVLAVCALQAETAPAAEIPNQWALNVFTITAITMQWQWRPALTVPVICGLAVVYFAGSGADGAGQLLLVLRVAVEGCAARICYCYLRRTTREMDWLRSRRHALRVRVALRQASRRDEREYLSLVHDTVAATLLMASRRQPASDPAELARCARRDLEIFASRRSPQRLDARLDFGVALAELLRQHPLVLTVRMDPVPAVPARPALALLQATNEALTNVVRHADVGEARVTVRESGTGIVVVVSDPGRGFQPAAVPPHRRGVTGSIRDRLAGVGGRATVTSAPGAGTTVRMEWPG